MRTQLATFLDGQERTASSQALNNPIDIEEQHREHTYPDRCTPECNFITCGFRTLENKGKPCFKKWKSAETKEKPAFRSVSPTLEQKLAKALQKVLKPYHDRLSRLENAPDYHVQRSLNGIPQEPLPVGYPRLFELRQAKHD